MTATALMKKASDTEIMRTKKGALAFPRFTMGAGARFLMEQLQQQGHVVISLDDFTRAFHGHCSATTRKSAKRQIATLVRACQADGWAVIQTYDELGRISGLVYVKQFPDPDPDDVRGMCNAHVARAKELNALSRHRSDRLEVIFERIAGESSLT